MKKLWIRGLAPTSWAVMLVAAGCDEPLPCQFAQDMAAPSDMSADPDMPAQLTSFSCRCTDQFGRPLQGVVVSLGGKSATSAADGSFTLSDVPVSARVIKLDGSAVTPPPDPEVIAESRRGVAVAEGVATRGPRRYGAVSAEVTLTPGVTSGREDPFVLPLSNPLEDLNQLLTDDNLTKEDIFFTAPSDGYEDALGLVQLRIARGTRINFPAGSPRALSLTRVPPQATPGTQETGAAASFILMIQPMGTTFDPPVELVTPAQRDSPDGQRQDLMTLNLDTGRYVRVGAGTVVRGEGDAVIIPDAVARLSRAGYHLALCPPVTLTGIVRRGETPQANARVELFTPDSISQNYEIGVKLAGVSATTGVDGRYSLSGLRACSLYTRARSESPAGVLALSGLDYRVNEGQPLSQDLVFDAEQSYRRFNLRVRVKNPLDMDKPFPGVSVYALECLGGECYGETDDKGEVLLRDVIGPPDGSVEVELCGNRGGSQIRTVSVPQMTPAAPACGVFQAADVQVLDVSTNCGSGSGSG